MKKLAAMFLAMTVSGSAQFLYNERLDKKSQDALTAAKAVVSNDVFDKEVQNLDGLWKFSSDQLFQRAELQMSADLAGFYDWRQVAKVVTKAGRDLGVAQQQSQAEKQRSDQLKKQLDADQAAAADALKKLKAQAATVGKDFPEVSTWLGRLGQLSTLEDYVKKVKDPGLSSTNEALIAELSGTFKGLADLYKNFQVALPASPKMVVLQSELELVKAGEEHLVQTGLIQARLETDLEELQSLATLAETSRKCVMEGVGNDCAKITTNDVAATLEGSVHDLRVAQETFLETKKDADDAALQRARRRLDNQLSFLAMSAALAARGKTAFRLAELRLTDENQRYQIRESAVTARSYEQILVNGAQRLSLYHQGGIRPETLARFLNVAATVGVIPALLTK